jgi:polysaccharide export outer membrane protein
MHGLRWGTVVLYGSGFWPYLPAMKLLSRGLLATVAIAVSVALAARAEAQLPFEIEPGSSVRTRSDLEQLLRFYEDAILSPAYSDQVKASLSVDAARVRARLRDGDFKLGDRIVLSVQGEPNLPDTVPVLAGPMITLPLFGDIPLDGVLRSEVEAHITEALATYLREPRVTAQGLMRVSVQGGVRAPGFYVVPADMLLSEALMVAGGPAPTADLEDLRIERGMDVLMEGTELQEALRGGLSLDQLNLQAGDQVVLPERGQGIFSNVALVVGLITSITVAIVQLTR